METSVDKREILKKEFKKNSSYLSDFNREDVFESYITFRVVNKLSIKEAMKLAYAENGLNQFYFKNSSKNATVSIDVREYEHSLLPTYDKIKDSKFITAYNRIAKIGVKKYCVENNCMNRFHAIHSVLKRNRKYFDSKYFGKTI